jgi:hypothetical protein
LAPIIYSKAVGEIIETYYLHNIDLKKLFYYLKMKDFPNKLHVTNKATFTSLFYERLICYLRKDIYEHVIREDENSYFEIDNWCRKHLKNDEEMMAKMVETLREELHELGWKTALSFGATALFIYSSDEPPKSCW